MNCGLKINDMSFNSFCYADDLLLTSTTAVGLQKLINCASGYIKSIGLNFNPTKTECIVFGKLKYNPVFTLNNTQLSNVSKISYLGVTLSNTSGKNHSLNRVNAGRRAFYGLQGAGLCNKGVAPDTAVHTWNVAVRPVLLYGCECVSMSQSARSELDKCQSKMIKAMCGLKRSCRNTPLLNALKVNSISSSIESQQVKLLKSMLISSSMSKYFYTHLLSQYLSGSHVGNSLLHRVGSWCSSHNKSLVSVLCIKDSYNSLLKSTKCFPENDGLIDSVRGLLFNSNYNGQNNTLLNLLLKSF